MSLDWSFAKYYTSWAPGACSLSTINMMAVAARAAIKVFDEEGFLFGTMYPDRFVTAHTTLAPEGI